MRAFVFKVFLFLAIILVTHTPTLANEGPSREGGLTPTSETSFERIARMNNRSRALFFRSPATNSKLRGWSFLYEKLVLEGHDPSMVKTLLADKRMPKWTRIPFAVKPVEPRRMYRKHVSRAAQDNAVEFYAKHRSTFQQAEKQFGVPRSVVLAILQVETQCGKFTGRSKTFHRLARLGAIAEPKNVKDNFENKKTSEKDLAFEKVEARAKWLEKTFLPHVGATIFLSQHLNQHPLEMRGSHAGAIGLPQFLPGNVALYGIDADKSGTIDLYSPADAIFSTANFLKHHGWTKPNMSHEEKKQVIYHYNASDAYVDTILALAEKVRARVS